MTYTAFANYYDSLTSNVGYSQRAAYFDSLLKKYGTSGPILLDLACGTGSLTVEFAKLGYDVIGVDRSAEMLSVAMEKRWESGLDILLLCQDMTQLDLYGTVDATVCALDSINHVTDSAAVQQIFDKVSLFTAPGGLFVFDVNTIYKHKEVLGNNTFVYDCDDVYCIWQNTYCDEDKTVSINLDFFEYDNHSGGYYRSSESFCEKAYPTQQLEQMLKNSGLELLAVYGDDTMEPPVATTQRQIFVARKPGMPRAEQGSRKAE